MKYRSLSIIAGIFGLLAAVGSVVLPHAQNASADEGFKGASYVTTVKDSMGKFASRGVITLHADHTVSVIDSGQGGPTFFFSSQLGSWQPDGSGGLVARTIDFDFPSEGVARLDYTISFKQGGNQVTGTIILTNFPLHGNPLDGGGTFEGAFTFVGELIKP